LSKSALEVAHSFIAAINAEDVPALSALMTEDHSFIDALGNRFTGADKIVAGWRYFFHAFTMYRITIAHAISERDRAALFGEAAGRWRVNDRVLDDSWRAPAAWLATVREGKIAEWRVFCDTGWSKAPP
jgi:ketosteroid isomerase-like protein